MLPRPDDSSAFSRGSSAVWQEPYRSFAVTATGIHVRPAALRACGLAQPGVELRANPPGSSSAQPDTTL
jgi:hypothetical protein